jgi:hypothetical protein
MVPEGALMKRPGVMLALASLLGWLGCVTNPAVAAAGSKRCTRITSSSPRNGVERRGVP